jgi:hypothetical protein
MSKDELALWLTKTTDLSLETAENFVSLPGGEERAIELLEAHDRNREQKAEMTRSRERLRQAAY